MKKDPLAQLVKESGLTTSADFTNLTLHKLDLRMQRRLKRRYYLLLTATTLLCLLAIYGLLQAQYSFDVFGLIVKLPKVLMMIGISLLNYLIVLHLFILHKGITLKAPNTI